MADGEDDCSNGNHDALDDLEDVTDDYTHETFLSGNQDFGTRRDLESPNLKFRKRNRGSGFILGLWGDLSGGHKIGRSQVVLAARKRHGGN